jgi:hypothetical protein
MLLFGRDGVLQIKEFLAGQLLARTTVSIMLVGYSTFINRTGVFA